MPTSVEEFVKSPSPDNVQETYPTEALIAWLTEARKTHVNPEKVFSELQQAGWIVDEADWKEVDINGDGIKEWIITIYLYPHTLTWGRPGDFLIIGEEGVLYRFFSPDDYFCVSGCASPFKFWTSAPHIIAMSDMTGDGLEEIILDRQICGAHTCVQTYFVISNHFDVIENLVSLPFEREVYGDIISLYYDEEWTKTITSTYSEFRGINDVNEDGLSDLVIHGGTHGSAGSGIQRTRIETWSWDGGAIALTNVSWDPTDYRMHFLWEANDNYYFGNYAKARQLFLKVIDDETLKASPYNEAEYEFDSIRRFAAFRLLLISLLEDKTDEANNWVDWLNNHYSEYAITEGANMLLKELEVTGELSIACNVVTEYLTQFDRQKHITDPYFPTGALFDLGYANPSLRAEDVCLVIRK